MIAAALLLAASSTSWRQRSGWAGLDENGSCYMSQTFEGKGESELAIYSNGSELVISITNANWSARLGEGYQARFLIGEHVFDGTAAGVGQAGDAKRGILVRIREADLDLLASAPSIAIILREQFVDKLSLTGSAAAISHFRSCLRSAEAERARVERERQKWADRPDDPFRTEPQSKNDTATRIAGFFDAANYPPSAIRAGASGSVRVRIAIANDGRVDNCSVVISSGNEDLDTTTCRIMRSRVRLGDFAHQTIEQTIDWKLPEP